MQNTVLAKPNLKLFLLGALMIALAYDFLSNGKSQASVFRPGNPRIGSFVTDDELTALLREVEKKPNVEGFLRISEAYERRGDIRKARQYLRRAEIYERIGQDE
jgi:hypothetical protein